MSAHLSSSYQTHNTQLRSKMTSMVAFPMAVTERTQNRVISIFSYLAGKAAPRRPADFTGVFYAPEYPLDGLGSVSFLQISWIRPNGDMPVSLTQNPPWVDLAGSMRELAHGDPRLYHLCLCWGFSVRLAYIAFSFPHQEQRY